MFVSMSTSKCKINVGGKYFLLFYEGFLSVTLLQKHVQTGVFWLVSLISSHMPFFCHFSPLFICKKHYTPYLCILSYILLYINISNISNIV